MHTFPRNSSRFRVFKSPKFGLRAFGSLDGKTFADFKTGLWNTLKFLGALPLMLAMLVVNLLSSAAAILVPVLLIPLAIFAPALVISALILATGALVRLFGG